MKMRRSEMRADKTEALLRSMPATYADIMLRTGFAERSVKRWLGELRAAGWAHISRWVRSHPGGYRPVFRAGPGVDAVALDKIPAAQSVAKSRAKAKADGRLEFQRAKDRAGAKARRAIASGRKATPFDLLF